MRIKNLIILIISVLVLNACGVKGPVKPIKKKSADTVHVDNEANDKTGSCGN